MTGPALFVKNCRPYLTCAKGTVVTNLPSMTVVSSFEHACVNTAEQKALAILTLVMLAYFPPTTYASLVDTQAFWEAG